MKIAVIHRELFLLLLTIAHCRNAPTHSDTDKYHWYDKNIEFLKDRMRSMQPRTLPRVRNVIIFIGDGMGVTTVTASRTYKRQISNDPNAKLTFDDFPATALMHTDILNSQISESAASATALFCGVKTNFESLGIDSTAMGIDACKNTNSHTPSIIKWAQEKNLKTGFVTTTRVTHATPAALYAHSRRHHEDDSIADSHSCKDIARQLIENEPGKNINVIMGGGLRGFMSNTSDVGRRKDLRNLTAEWIDLHPSGEFVTSRDELLNISKTTEYLLGMFAKSHLKFNADRDPKVEPSLAEMTKMAIDVLKRNNPEGFLLIVEAGKIDLAHHYNNAYRALDDTLQLDEAVDVALRNIDLSNSLVIVTADHASAMSYTGFATPKNLSVLGMDKYVSNVNGKSYQLLTYSSGLGYENYNETIALHDYRNAYHKATIASTWASHAADDVPIYATGLMANLLFSGTFDQTYLAHAVAYAMCIFEYKERCNSNVNFPGIQPGLKINESKIRQLYKESLKNPQPKPRNDLQKLISSSTTINSVEKFSDEINEATQQLEEKFESSDLVGNVTAHETSSCTINNFNVHIVAVMLLIKCAFY